MSPSRPKANTGLIILDLFLLMVAYFFMAWLKSGPQYLEGQYLIGFFVVVILWIINSFYLKKYHITKKEKPLYLFRTLIYPNLLTTAFVAFIIYAFGTTFFSRMMVFGTVGIATLLEMLFFGLFTYAIRSQIIDHANAFLEKPPTPLEKKRMAKAIVHSQFLETRRFLHEAIIDECGEKVADYIDKHSKLGDPGTLMLSTTTRFNVLKQQDDTFHTIINLKRVNDFQFINKFFESVNHKLLNNGLFIGFGETKNLRKRRILGKFPPVLNWIAYALVYIIKRVLPKFKPTQGIYFFLTRGQNKVLTRAEILGRLYSCGFEIVDDSFANGYFVFVAKRIKEPAFDMNPTYGPFVRLRRVGKDGKMINFYKLRTMHPYAEYLQDYIHKANDLQEGGKFKNDFRVSTLGKIFRALWIDELPMLYNWLKRDLKLVGVRPISEQYFNLYDKDLQELRIKSRPGLVPPFYADLPKTLEEIQDSERKYLEAYFEKPVRTDWKYFWKAFGNIVFRKARSA